MHAHHRGEIRPESRPKPSCRWQGPFRVGWAESASPIRPDIPGCPSRYAAARWLPSGPPINPRPQVVGPGAIGTFADLEDASIAPIFGPDRPWEPRYRPRRKWTVPVGQVRRPALYIWEWRVFFKIRELRTAPRVTDKGEEEGRREGEGGRGGGGGSAASGYSNGELRVRPARASGK